MTVFKLQRSVERGLSNGVPSRVIASTLGLSPRQVRRYSARIRLEWARQVEDSHLDAALARLRGDAERARSDGTMKGLAIAVRTEEVMAKLLAARTGLASSSAATSDAREFSDEQLVDHLNLAADIRDLLAAENAPLEAVVVEAEPSPSVASRERVAVVVPAAPVPSGASDRADAVEPQGQAAVVVEEVTRETIVTAERTVTTSVTVFDGGGRALDEHGFSSPGQRRAYNRARGLRSYDD